MPTSSERQAVRYWFRDGVICENYLDIVDTPYDTSERKSLLCGSKTRCGTGMIKKDEIFVAAYVLLCLISDFLHPSISPALNE